MERFLVISSGEKGSCPMKPNVILKLKVNCNFMYDLKLLIIDHCPCLSAVDNTLG